MQEHFKIPTDGKVTSSPLRKCLLPLVSAKITRAEFSSEEGSDSLKRSEMSKNKGKGKDLDCKPRYCDSRVGFHLRFPALEVAFRKSGGCPCGHSLSCPHPCLVSGSKGCSAALSLLHTLVQGAEAENGTSVWETSVCDGELQQIMRSQSMLYSWIILAVAEQPRPAVRRKLQLPSTGSLGQDASGFVGK